MCTLAISKFTLPRRRLTVLLPFFKISFANSHEAAMCTLAKIKNGMHTLTQLYACTHTALKQHSPSHSHFIITLTDKGGPLHLLSGALDLLFDIDALKPEGLC